MDNKMVIPKYSPFQSVIQKITATRFGIWLFSRITLSGDKLMLKLSRGRATMTNLLSGLPVIVLTMTGAKSGLSRTLPLVYVRDPQDPHQFALIASNFGNLHHPAWYFNLKAFPRVTGSIRGQVKTYLVHEASAEEYARFWQLAETTYPGFPIYKQLASSRVIPIMVLAPE